jgi:DNA-binding transcriptional LysR family regulator
MPTATQGFDWNDVKAFLAVARGGSTLAAAKALGVNQTTVARRVEALEAAVGLRLFERGQTGSKLTEAGEDLMGEAGRMEAAAQGFGNRAASHQRGLAGTLRVTATEILANLIITPALAEFRALYPDVRVDLAITDRTLDLAHGEADVALRAGISLTASDLVARKIGEFDFALYCSRDYAARRGIPTCLEDLRDHDVIGGDGERMPLPGMGWLYDRLPGLEPATRSSSMTNVQLAVKSGLGVAPVPCLAADPDPDLIQCHPPIPELRTGAWVMTRAELKDTPRVRAFIDFIVPHFTAVRKRLEAEGEAMKAHKAASVVEFPAKTG